MTTTKIEYEETVTKTEDVYICDDCGREVDKFGATLTDKDSDQYVQPEVLDAFGATLTDKDSFRSVDMHFCSECYNRLNEEWEPEYVKRADDWLDESELLSKYSRREYFQLAENGVVLSSTVLAVVGIAIFFGAQGIALASCLSALVANWLVFANIRDGLTID
jgi:uncharacterized protein YlaI